MKRLVSKKNMFDRYINEEKSDDTDSSRKLETEVDEKRSDSNTLEVVHEDNFELLFPRNIIPWEENQGPYHPLTKMLVNAGYSSPQRIATAPVEILTNKFDISPSHAKTLVRNAQRWVSMNFVSAASLLDEKEKVNKIPTLCKSLDKILNGGIEPKAITEFFGEYITGKTQICMQLAVNNALPISLGGLESNSLIIDTEGAFNPQRLVQIIKKWDVNVKDILERITVGRAFTSDIQIAMLNNLKDIIHEKKITLLIIDSLTSTFRSEYSGKDSIYERQQKLNQHIQQLLRIADIENIAVVVTNQVMSEMKEQGKVKPVGGNVLAHGISHRIHCTKSRMKSTVRFANIVASSSLPDAKAAYEITKYGISDVSQ